MKVTRHVIAITTDSGGNATAFSETDIDGMIYGIKYVPDGSVPLATGATVVLSGEVTGKAILTQANLGTVAREWAPRQPTHSNADGSANLYAAAGAAVMDCIPISDERIKLVVSLGGIATLGTLYVWTRGF